MSGDRRADHLRGWLAEGSQPAAQLSVSGARLLDALASAPPIPAAPWPPGTRVGRYVIVRAVGAGGMGAVYLAEDDKLKRPVALKRLHGLHGSVAQTARERLLREAQALARLSHPAVVHVYDCDSDGDALYLVMEYVDGVPLRQWLQTPRSLPEILAVFRAVGEGLAAAHAVGLVHRDFKPDNVMIDHHGRARVLDFGLARAVRELGAAPRAPSGGHPSLVSAQLTAAGLLVGTPAYLAPEQILGAEAGPQSDQWSFCVSLYEAVHGVRPFDAPSQAELYHDIVHAPPAPPPTPAPAELARVLEVGLAKRPEQRFANMQHLLITLEAVPQTSVAVAITPVSAPRRRSALPWIFGVAGFVALATLMAFAWLAVRDDGAPGDKSAATKKSKKKKKKAAESEPDAPTASPEPAPTVPAAEPETVAPAPAPAPPSAPPPAEPAAPAPAPVPAPPPAPPAPAPETLCNRTSDCPGPNAACVVGKCKSCPAGQLYVMGGCRSQCTSREQCGKAGEWDCYRPSLSLPNAYCVPFHKR